MWSRLKAVLADFIQQADLVLRIYEAGLVEPGLEKVSILG